MQRLLTRSAVVLIGLIATTGQLIGQELLPMQQKSDWGFINKDGEWVIEPQYPQVVGYSDGLAMARMKDKNQWGYLNQDGEWAIQPKFGNIHSAYRIYAGKKLYDPPLELFKNELAPVLVNDTLGVINKAGEIVKKLPDYTALRNFHQGLAAFQKDDKWGFLNKDWEVVIEPQYEDVGDFHNGLAYCQKGFGSLYGFINKKGEEAIEPQFEEAHRFGDGLAPAKSDAFEPYGYINKKGEWAIEPEYEEAEPFSNGLAFVKKEQAVYYINKERKEVISPPIDGFKICHGYPFENGIAMVTIVKATESCMQMGRLGTIKKGMNTAYAYIDRSGNFIYKQPLKKARYLKNKYDSIKKAEREAEKRQEKARKKREKAKLAECPDMTYYGDTTAGSYVELGYRGVKSRFYFNRDVFEKKPERNYVYHIPSFQDASGEEFLNLRPVTFEPSFLDKDKLEAQDLGYRFSLSHDCINFPSDATEDGEVKNNEKTNAQPIWEEGHIRYNDINDTQKYILIHMEPNEIRENAKKQEEVEGTPNQGFITTKDEEEVSLKDDDQLKFKYYPNQEELNINFQVTEETDGSGGGVSIHSGGAEIENFKGETGKYYNNPVHRFDRHYITYFQVKAYASNKVHIKHYKKPIKERVKQVDKADLTFSEQYLIGEYKGSDLKKGVDPKPVQYDLSKN